MEAERRTAGAALGLETGIARVVPYDGRWPILFKEAAAELHRALGGGIVAVHHVGSTAVPGLAAKPVLDVLVSVRDFAAARALFPSLARLGYEFRADEEIPDRHYFRRRQGTTRTHHLSLAEPSSHYHRVTLAFRDALRRDAALAAEYALLKVRLATDHPRDRVAYTAGKTSFVERVLRQALGDAATRPPEGGGNNGSE